MSYVDAFFNKKNDSIEVVERTDTGKRVFKSIPARYTFYYKDPNGRFRSIYDEPLSQVKCRNTKELRVATSQMAGKRLYESDLRPVNVHLAETYINQPAPKLHIAFFDIETDFLKDRGYAPPSDPFAPITAITVYLNWLEQTVTLGLIPSNITAEKANELVADIPNVHLFTSEGDMLSTFLDLIDDVDIISAWNGDAFDIPYTVNRVARILSKDDTKRFCHWNQLPKKREYEKYGKTQYTYDLIGRIHLDLLEIYRKFTFEERHSYRLDAIGEIELGEHKVQYEGTLDQLYHEDFREFIKYNIQDVMLMANLEKKLKFLELANVLAHENTVTLPTIMGTVTMVDQAILNEAHRRGLHLPDRNHNQEEAETKAAGAYVAHPKVGLQDWVGSLDVNSLYPSVIRALNMGPETIMGQLRQTLTAEFLNKRIAEGATGADAWENVFGSLEYTAVMDQRKDITITVDWEDGSSFDASGAEVYDLIFNSRNPWCLSANGTIFTYEREGIIPGLLTRWYAERKEFQKKKKEFGEAGDKLQEAYWDSIQHIKKILLNSVFGYLLNSGAKFFDRRVGQSITLTGRQVAKHMASAVNEMITGKYDHTGKAVIYGDSVTGDTLIPTSNGNQTIEQLFNDCSEHYSFHEKEYAINSPVSVTGFNSYEMDQVVSNIRCVIRHKTDKLLYKVTSENNKSVIVTADHSLMVDRDGELLEITPTEFQLGDQLITLVNGELEWSFLQSIVKIGMVDDYVYDLSIAEQDPLFFGNELLLRNTDSVFFSAYNTLKPDIDRGLITWNHDTVVDLYDKIGEQVNDSFPDFMKQQFHCIDGHGDVIKAGREIVGSKALFITKKRYAVLYYDKDGKRYDVGGKPGKFKVMGLDLRRSDTPVFVQKFLSEVLELVLTGEPEDVILNAISEFRELFKDRPGWEKGTPKRVNNVSAFRDKEAKGKTNMPGHVRAALNWNTLKRLHKDPYSMEITDGMKTIVCKLRKNPMGFTSIGYPIDEMRLPEWFKELPFDHAEMAATIVDKKLKNLIGVLDYDIRSTETTNLFNSLFE